MLLLIFGLMLLNFGISWFNAWSVGKAWVETKEIGGWSRILAWCGAVMSACGFTWVYLILLALGAYALGWLTEEYVEAMLSLGYLVIILPMIGSGLGITIDSWARLARRKDWTSGGVAGWNTFAQGYNTYQAVSAIPDALDSVLKAFTGKKSGKNGAMAALVIILVILAVTGGAMTTAAIIRATARSDAQTQLRREYA